MSTAVPRQITQPRLAGRYDGPTSLSGMVQLASVLSRVKGSGLIPEIFNGNPEGIVAVMYAARALDIPLWTAMHELYQVDGSTRKRAALIRALWLRHGVRYGCEVTTTEAIGWVQRPGEEEKFEVTYTIQQAELRGLHETNDEWRKQPDAMLFARWTTRAANRWTPHIILGLSDGEMSAGADGEDWSTGEEIGPEVLRVLEEAGRAIHDGEGVEGLRRIWRANEILLDEWAGQGESLRKVLERRLVEAATADGDAPSHKQDPAPEQDQDQEGGEADADGGEAGRSPEDGQDDVPQDAADGEPIDAGTLECGCRLDDILAGGGRHPRSCALIGGK